VGKLSQECGRERLARTETRRTVAAMSESTIPTLHGGIDAVTNGGDQRLLYGIGVPFLVMTALIIAFVLDPTWYFLALLMASVIAVAGVVIWGILRMLDEDENEPG
jgi:hypothetical protein